jgi:hypothetical protein
VTEVAPAAAPERRYYRVRDVQTMLGTSKPWVFARIKCGDLQAVKLRGVLLITSESVEGLLGQAQPWKPGKPRGGA